MMTPYMPPRPIYDETQDRIRLPEKFGPGVWWILSTTASNADTATKMLAFCQFLKDTIEHIPCLKCRGHATDYINTTPPNSPKYFGMKDPSGQLIGMAFYMWEFHEAINLRLNKPSFPWIKFLPRYKYGTDECTTPECKAGAEVKEVAPPLPEIVKGTARSLIRPMRY